MMRLCLALLVIVGAVGCGVEIRTYERESLSIHHLVVGVGNVWAIETADGFVLVDLAEKGDADEIIQGLAQLNRQPADVDFTVITHAHMDHGGPVKRMQEEGLFPVALGAADIPIAEAGLSVPGTTLIWEGEVVRLIVDESFPPWTPDVVIGDAELDLSIFGIPGRVVPMPGHTAGSVVVVLETGDAFVGDLVRGDAPLIGKGDNEGEATTHFFSDDQKADRDHLDDVIGLGADVIFPGHGPYMSSASLRGWLADRAFELGD